MPTVPLKSANYSKYILTLLLTFHFHNMCAHMRMFGHIIESLKYY